MTRRIAAAVAALLLLAACSSGDDSDAASSTTSTTAGASDEAAYVDAVYGGLLSETPAASKDDMRCVAEAIVRGIGVDRFHDAGVTVAQAGDPEFEPPQSIADAMNAADRVAMATRLQSCDLGRIVGSEVSLQFAQQANPEAEIDRSEVECFGRGYEGAAARPMIGGLMLNDVSLLDSTRLARLTIDCIGLASIIGSAVGAELTEAESACIDRAGRTDTTFLRVLANEFRNVQSTAETAQQRFGAPVVACLTPAHRSALAQRS